MGWAFKGLSGTNKTGFLLEEYYQKKALAELGYRFDSDELLPYEVEAYTLIKSTLAELEEKALKKSSKGK